MAAHSGPLLPVWCLTSARPGQGGQCQAMAAGQACAEAACQQAPAGLAGCEQLLQPCCWSHWQAAALCSALRREQLVQARLLQAQSSHPLHQSPQSRDAACAGPAWHGCRPGLKQAGRSWHVAARVQPWSRRRCPWDRLWAQRIPRAAWPAAHSSQFTLPIAAACHHCRLEETC